MTRAWLTCLVLLALAGRAGADDVPWAAGVPEEQQARAEEIFAEANQLFGQRAHAAALARYREAIALWDHPMIQFNMAVTLVRLERALEAADALDAALRFGAAPFTPELHQQALDYQLLLRNQLGYLEASSDQPGTRISLDGKPWFVAPGRGRVRVLAGTHSLLAELDGHVTIARRLLVGGGATTSEVLQLVPLQTAMITTYRHPRWLPWSVVGSGAALALGGGLGFYLAGSSRMSEFSKQFLQECPTGCEADLSMHPDLADQRDAARRRYSLAVGAVATGGLVAISGVVWVLLNRPRRSLPVELAPGPGGVSARASWTF